MIAASAKLLLLIISSCKSVEFALFSL